MGARIIRRNIVAHNLFIMSILFFRFCNKIGTVKHLWTFTVSCNAPDSFVYNAI